MPGPARPGVAPSPAGPADRLALAAQAFGLLLAFGALGRQAATSCTPQPQRSRAGLLPAPTSPGRRDGILAPVPPPTSAGHGGSAQRGHLTAPWRLADTRGRATPDRGHPTLPSALLDSGEPRQAVTHPQATSPRAQTQTMSGGDFFSFFLRAPPATASSRTPFSEKMTKEYRC